VVEAHIEPGDVTVIRVAGEVDMDTHVEMEDAILGALRSGAGPVVVDLAEVSFLDSSGVRALLHGREAAIGRGTTLTVRSPQPIVANVLRLTNVAELLGLSSS
jgi:anti-sigma B factor antagonist